MPAQRVDHGIDPMAREELLDALFRLGQMVANAHHADVFTLAASTAALATGAQDAFVVTTRASDAPTLGIRSCLHAEREDCFEDERTVRKVAAEALDERAPVTSGSLWAVPILAGQTPLGALVMAGTFLEKEGALGWVRAVANQLSFAIEREAAAAEKEETERAFELLDDVARDCAGLALDALLPSVIRRIREVLNAPVSMLLFADAAHDELVVAAVSSDPRVVAPVSGARTRSRGLGLRAMSSQQPRRGLATQLGFPDLVPFENLPEHASAVAAPLIVGKRAVGVVATLRSKPFTEDELRLVSVLCAQVAVSVDNARLMREASHRATELDVMQSAAEGLTRSLDSSTLVGHAIERLCAVLECEVACVYLLERGVFEAIHQHGMTAENNARSTRVKGNEPIIGEALVSGVPIDRRVMEVGEPTRAFFLELSLQRVAAAPLLIVRPGEPDAPGVVLLGRRDDRAFASDELRVISAITSLLCVALQNAWLFAETHRRMEEMSIVVDAGGALARPAFERDALNAVTRRLASLLKVADCSLFVVDDEGRALVGRGASRPQGSPDFEDVRLDLDSDALGAGAARTGEIRHLTRPENNPLVAKLMADQMPAFVTAVPLMFADRAVAVLYLADFDASKRLTPLALERVMALGAQLAVAIERTRLFNALEASLSQLADAQRELVRRERLAALGEMTALVAHEIRNPLGVIFNSLGSLGWHVEFEGDARTAFRILGEEADRLNRIVGDMLDYTRPLRLSRVPAALDKIVKDALESTMSSERRRGTPVDEILFEFHAPQSVPAMRVDEQLVHQAVVNLLSNAMQSAGKGGCVRVSLSSCGRGEQTYARIQIEDDGAGFPEDIRARLFEPFVTTKATGSGLGLAVVRRVMDAHEGRVTLADRLGGGTVFCLDFSTHPLPSRPHES